MPTVGPVEVFGPAFVVGVYQFMHYGVLQFCGIALKVIVAQLQFVSQVPPQIARLTFSYDDLLLWEIAASLRVGFRAVKTPHDA